MPAGQKQHVGSGQRPLTVAARDCLDHDGIAIDTPRRMKEKTRNPQKDEIKATFQELVVFGGGPSALVRNCPAPKVPSRRRIFATRTVGN